jgi:hypothetical protein
MANAQKILASMRRNAKNWRIEDLYVQRFVGLLDAKLAGRKDTER